MLQSSVFKSRFYWMIIVRLLMNHIKLLAQVHAFQLMLQSHDSITSLQYDYNRLQHNHNAITIIV